MRARRAQPYRAPTDSRREHKVDHSATVQEMYAAFGRGDVPAILEHLAEDVTWEPVGTSVVDDGVPWLARRSGRDGAAEFFASLEPLEFRRFEPLAFIVGDGELAVRIRIDVTVKASGYMIDDEEIHLWTFDDAGRVTSFRHALDTAKHIEAARSLAAA
jgi:hypothetical protein